MSENSNFIPAHELPGIEKVEAPEIKKEENTKRLDELLDSLIMDSFITKEVTIGKTKFVLKTLSTGEFIESSYVYIAAAANVSDDIVARVRLISNLSYAIVSINDVPIETEDKAKERDERDKIYSMLLKMPPPAVDALTAAFGELVEEQNNAFSNLGDNITNF